MGAVNGITLKGLPVYDPPTNSLEPVNFFEMHTGGARYGWGKFLMRESDYETIAKTDPVSLVMSSGDNASGQQLTFDVVVAGYFPYSTSVATGDTVIAHDMVSVIVFDKRRNFYGEINKQINVQVQGFPLNSDNTPITYNSSNQASGGTLHTWSDVFTNVLNVQTKGIANAKLPSWNPRNMSFDNTPQGQAIDYAAGRIIQVVGFDGSNFAIYDIGVQSSANTSLASKMASYRIAGGLGNTNNASLPDQIGVTFRHYDNTASITDKDDAFNAPNYVKTVNTTFGSEYTLPLMFPDYVAITAGSTTRLNDTELTTVATDLVARWSKKAMQNRSEEVFAGIWPVFPDGKIWGIRWSSTPAYLGGGGGATTTVLCFDDSEFSRGDGFRQIALNLHAVGNGTGVNYGTSSLGGPDLVFARTGSSLKEVKVTAIPNASGGVVSPWVTAQPLDSTGSPSGSNISVGVIQAHSVNDVFMVQPCPPITNSGSPLMDASNKSIGIMEVGNYGTVFECACNQSGGTNGSAGVICSFTYYLTVTGASGTVNLAGPLSRTKPPPFAYTVGVATKCLAKISNAGAWVLIEPYESQSSLGC